ncbi:MAG: multicopper oxidase family protein [Betaproteobacteria bacterium]|nr:multicopper oxidase family protein [Betaproteobacteria bacterium]
MKICTTNLLRRWARLLGVLATAGCALTAQAAVPGITGTAFNLTASADRISQPDGASIYAWGYGCSSGYTPTYAPAAFTTVGMCPLMQMPGPTMIVTEGQTFTVTLTNKLPALAGNTSIVFPGLQVTPAGGVPGLMAQEAANGGTVTYTVTAAHPGTYAYYSGTQPELQIEMGLYGAVIVLPATAPSGCTRGDFSNSASAYDIAASCYDREYLFEFSEMNSRVHDQVEAQVNDPNAKTLNVTIEPFHPNYYLINGRSMPDDMDTHYSAAYPHQPYNGNPHMHPGERVLMRVIGQGRWQHPFHFHGNHARVLARDGNLLVAQNDPTKLAGPLLFTIPTVSGQTVDAIFTWTGQGLNWDAYGSQQPHSCNGVDVVTARTAQLNPSSAASVAVLAQLAGTSGNGAYPTPFDPTTHEFCPDHGKDIPVTPPDPNIVANGLWYGGTPYLGLQGNNLTPLPPGQTRLNANAGYAYMWHSHNEREITTNDVFPGGMMMMLIIDPPGSTIDETQ